jgi:hypothetical protein
VTTTPHHPHAVATKSITINTLEISSRCRRVNSVWLKVNAAAATQQQPALDKVITTAAGVVQTTPRSVERTTRQPLFFHTHTEEEKTRNFDYTFCLSPIFLFNPS